MVIEQLFIREKQSYTLLKIEGSTNTIELSGNWYFIELLKFIFLTGNKSLKIVGYTGSLVIRKVGVWL